MAPQLSCDVSEGVWKAIEQERLRSGESLSAIVERALAAALEVEYHSIFQVSTSNALVQGVFRGAVTVRTLKEHGDFGLGTFEGLDGELIMIDGVCHRATFGGAVNVVDDDARVPFAVMTRFADDLHSTAERRCTLADLTRLLDDLRPSENLFAAVRVDGIFRRLMLRAACPAAPGEGLVEAVQHQSDFSAPQREGPWSDSGPPSIRGRSTSPDTTSTSSPPTGPSVGMCSISRRTGWRSAFRSSPNST
jgi:acetolactate decarboxylase